MEPSAKSRLRLVLTAVAFGVCLTLLGLMLLGAAVGSSSADEEPYPGPNKTAFLLEVRPHMALKDWTDLRLIEGGNYVCNGLWRDPEGFPQTLITEVVAAYQAQGYTEADLPRIQNDWAFIALSAAHELGPEWSVVMDAAFDSMS